MNELPQGASEKAMTLYDVMKTALEVQFPFNMLIILGAMGIVFAMIGLIATEVRKYLTHRNEVELKQEMVARGMSAEEIERVLKADAGSSKT